MHGATLNTLYIYIYIFLFRSLLFKKVQIMDSAFNYGLGAETDSAPSDGPNSAPFVISLLDVVTEM
jgi:hypothetical protein